MKKSDLVLKVAELAGLERKVADKAVIAVIDAISGALEANDKVQLMGFGTFEIKERAAHQGRNPATGQPIEIAASKAPVFKAGKKLKEMVK